MHLYVCICVCVCCLNIVNSSGFFFFFCSLGSLRTKVGASGKTEEIENAKESCRKVKLWRFCI